MAQLKLSHVCKRGEIRSYSSAACSCCIAPGTAETHLELTPDQLSQYHFVRDKLLPFFPCSEDYRDWLFEENEWLDGDTPIEAVRKGKILQLMEFAKHTEQGGYL